MSHRETSMRQATSACQICTRSRVPIHSLLCIYITFSPILTLSIESISTIRVHATMTNSPLQPRALRYSYHRLRIPRPYTARRLLIDVPPPSKPISDVSLSMQTSSVLLLPPPQSTTTSAPTVSSIQSAGTVSSGCLVALQERTL